MLAQLLENLLAWIHQYGPIALFFLLALGIIILPIPDEPLMIAVGYLISKGDLQPIPTFIAAVLGAWCGITVSYYIGVYLGPYLAPYIISTRVGKILGITESRFLKAQRWFSRIGKWSLFIGYFIPGFRHFSGYIAGSLGLPYYQFSLFAYSGGLLWASFFLTIGYTQGNTIMAFLIKLWSFLSHLVN